MAQYYADDQTLLTFSSISAVDGRYYTNTFVVAGSSSWTFTIIDLPTTGTNFGLRIEVNNSRYNIPGNQGIINPLINALNSTNYNPQSISATKDINFDSRWVPYKPESEFYITSFPEGSRAICSSDSGVFPIQGAVRYLRLSMSAQPTTATCAFFFDSVNILRG